MTGAALAAYMLVNTVYDLQNINNNLSGTYALGKGIDATGFGFNPIGQGTPFTGRFDGSGGLGVNNTIDKLTITPTTNNVGDIGLFGVIGTGGVVKNLNLSNVSIHANPGFTTGSQFVGALAGTNAGTVDNVVVTGGTVDGGTVNGTPFGTLYIGGLVGQNGFYFNNSTVVPGTIRDFERERVRDQHGHQRDAWRASRLQFGRLID